MIAIHLVMFAHLEATKAVMLAGLEDPDRATKVIGTVLHRGDPMPTAPPNGKHVSSVDKNTASANVNATGNLNVDACANGNAKFNVSATLNACTQA